MDVDALRADFANALKWHRAVSAGEVTDAHPGTAQAVAKIAAVKLVLADPGALELLALLNGPDDAMVERVARALWQARCEDQGEPVEWGRGGYKTARMGMLAEARAALAAVKEAK